MNQNRRQFLVNSSVLGAGLVASLNSLGWIHKAEAQTKPKVLTKKIPKSGQLISCFGMGTWITFNVGDNKAARENCARITEEFLKSGGQMIDSSPMYGSADEVIGYCLKNSKLKDKVFSAPKIWTSSTEEGLKQHQNSLNLWGLKSFDLQQVHNLQNFSGHFETLKKFKSEGKIKYLGVTTSHGRRHDELEKLIKSEPLDFVQLTYNISHTQAERLIHIAKDKGIAVIANRPLDGGNLMNQFKAKPLPAFAKEAGLRNWSEFFLKWIVSHPGMTVAIPATSKIEHMKENALAMQGEFFTEGLRKKMRQYILDA